MENAQIVAAWIIALGILNVWLIRSKLPTAYRGGNAANMREEFAVYGLPVWFMNAIGSLKVLLALTLIAGTWYRVVLEPASYCMAALMIGAVAMHVKVKDSFKKTLPSLIMLMLSVFVAMR